MTRRRWILGLAAGAAVLVLLLVALLPRLYPPSESHSPSAADPSDTSLQEGSARLLGPAEPAPLGSDATASGRLTITVRREGRPMPGAHLCALTRDAWDLRSFRRPMVWAELYAAAVARTVTNEQGVGHLEVSESGPFGVMASTDAAHVAGYIWRITQGESAILELPARREPLLVTVRTERGTPVEGARVRLLAGDADGAGFTLEATTERNGTCGLWLPARARRGGSLYADHPDLGHAVVYPEELGESITLYLETGRTVPIRVVDEAMQPLAATISYCLYKGGHILCRGRSEGLQSALDVAAVPRRATLCAWAVSPDGRFGIEAVEAPQEVVLVLGDAAEVACRIASPVTLTGDGGIWLIPPEASGGWRAIAEWGGADLGVRFLIPLSAQSNSVVLALPTGPRPTRTFRAQFDFPWILEWPGLRLEESDRIVRVSRNARTEAVLNLFLVQESVVTGVVSAARDGAPLEGVLVGSGHFDTDVLTRTDAWGRYRVTRKETRPFRLIFRAPGYRTFMSELVEPTPGAPVELDATLGRTGSVPGRVLAVDGRGLRGVRVRLLAQDGSLLADTRTDGRGWFHLEDAPTGWARVRADLGEHATPWEDAIQTDIEIPAPRDTPNMREVTLRASPGYQTATVSGGLRGLSEFGRAGAEFALLLRGRGERASVAIRATIRTGQYTFERVPFGEYDVCYVVSQGGVSVERTMTQIEVTEHPVRVSFGLPSSGYLHGRVLDEAGAPISGVLLAVVDAQTGVTASAGPSVHTDEDGVFALDVMQGRCYVEVRSKGLAGRSEEIRLLPRSLESCTVVARPGGSMRLQVRAGVEDRIDVSFTLDGPTARTERGLSISVQDGLATLPVHGLEAGVYTVRVLVGAESHLVESVEVTSGATTSVWIDD